MKVNAESVYGGMLHSGELDLSYFDTYEPTEREGWFMLTGDHGALKANPEGGEPVLVKAGLKRAD